MENTLKSIITNGLSLESVWSLIILMIVAFAIISIRNKLVAYADFRRVKNSSYISLGAKIRLPTTTGSVDGEILSITHSKVVIMTAETYEHIPISQFAASRKSLLIVPQPSTWHIDTDPEAETSS